MLGLPYGNGRYYDDDMYDFDDRYEYGRYYDDDMYDYDYDLDDWFDWD